MLQTGRDARNFIKFLHSKGVAEGGVLSVHHFGLAGDFDRDGRTLHLQVDVYRIGNVYQQAQAFLLDGGKPGCSDA